MLLSARLVSALLLSAALSSALKIISPMDETVVQSGHTIVVVCEGEGELKWKYPDKNNTKVNIRNDPNKTTLSLIEATFKDVGYYTCYEEKNNNEVEDRVYIYVKDNAHPVALSPGLTIVYGKLLGTVEIPCKPTSPDVTLHLIRQPDEEEVLPDEKGRIIVDKRGFVIHSASVTDEVVYMCCLYDSSNTCDDSQTYFISLFLKKKSSLFPPDLFVSKHAIAGTNVEMKCSSEAEATTDDLQLMWLIPNEMLSKAGHMKKISNAQKKTGNGVLLNVFEQTLQIFNVSNEDAGVYTCEVSNEIEKLNKSFEFHVHDGPFVNVSFSATNHVIATDGQNVTWVAYVDAFPDNFTVEWKDPLGKLIHPAFPYELVKNGNEVKLSIQNVTTRYQGKYILTIESSGKQHVSFPTLTVHGKPSTWIIKSEKRIYLQEEEDYTAKCQIRSSAKLVSVSWVLNVCTSDNLCTPKYLSNENRNSTDQKSGSLIISVYNFKCKESGNLSCTAKDYLGNDTDYIEIICEGVQNASGIVAGVVCVAIILITAVAFLAVRLVKEKKLRKRLSRIGLENFAEGAPDSMNPYIPIDEQADLLPYNKIWEFPREKLKFGKQLGSGAFGVVIKAEAYGILSHEEVTTVAIKMVKQNVDISCIKALVSELKIMSHLGKHLNIVNLLGACTDKISKRELLVIVEYCRFGNLHNYLIRNRKYYIDQIDPSTDSIDPNICAEILTKPESNQRSSWSNSKTSDIQRSNTSSSVKYIPSSESGSSERSHISMKPSGMESASSDNAASSGSRTHEWCYYYKGDDTGKVNPVCTQDLVCWSYQVANGMGYLADRRVLHGDLAARNILLAEGNIVKICDFGLAKNMYQTGVYKKKTSGPLPFKWMAVEAIKDRIFSTQSDVWSYGITLWEFFSLATTPYPGMEPDEKLLKRLINGYRLERPLFATHKIYQIMLSCWNPDPNERPSFPQLVEEFGKMLTENVRSHYVNLNEAYVRMSIKQDEEDYLSMAAVPDYNKLSVPLDNEKHHSYINSNPLSEENPETQHTDGYTEMGNGKDHVHDVGSCDTGFCSSDGSQYTAPEDRQSAKNYSKNVASSEFPSTVMDISQKNSEKKIDTAISSQNNNQISNPSYYCSSL